MCGTDHEGCYGGVDDRVGLTIYSFGGVDGSHSDANVEPLLVATPDGAPAVTSVDAKPRWASQNLASQPEITQPNTLVGMDPVPIVPVLFVV